MNSITRSIPPEGWTGIDTIVFSSLSKWIDDLYHSEVISLGAALLGKQLIVSSALTDDKHALACVYIADCVRYMERTEVETEVFENLSNQAVEDVVLALNGVILLFTPLDWLLSIRQYDSTVTDHEEDLCRKLFVNLSSHPNYYRLRADNLAAACLFYVGHAPNLIPSKTGWRFVLSEELVTIVRDMIEGEPSTLRRFISPSYPKSLPPVTILSKIAEGSYSTVMSALSSNVVIAIKIQAMNDEAIREMAIACTLSHPNVQSWIGFTFSSQGNLNARMTLQPDTLWGLIYKNHSFDQAMQQSDRVWIDGASSPFDLVSLLTRRKFARELLQALSYLKDMKIVHGDLKPDNLFISGEGTLLVSDFGISVAYAEPLLTTVPTSDIRYALEYRDPNVESKIFSFEADVWAAAVIILEMETGILPAAADPNLNFNSIGDWSLVYVCKQMLLRDVYTRITARQALVMLE